MFLKLDVQVSLTWSISMCSFVKVQYTMRTSHCSISISTFLYKCILLNFTMYFHLCRDREEESETHQDNAEAKKENNDSSHQDLANEYANICGLLFLSLRIYLDKLVLYH